MYIHEDKTDQQWPLGGASRWWLHHALESLSKSLHGKLNIFQGEPQATLAKLAAENNASRVYWNRCYEPQSIERDGLIKSSLKQAGLEVQSFYPLLPPRLSAKAGTKKASGRASQNAAAQT